MRITRPLEAFALNLNDSIFNFLLNLLPDGYLSNSHIRPRLARMLGLRCGPYCQIRKDIYFEAHGELLIGSNVLLNRQAYLDAVGGIRIGDNVRFGPQVMLVTGSHEVGTSAMRTGDLVHKPIVIGEGCWLGARVLVTAGVTIGRGSIVSAGSVVQRSMPADFLIAGNPARPISPLDPKGPAPDLSVRT